MTYADLYFSQSSSDLVEECPTQSRIDPTTEASNPAPHTIRCPKLEKKMAGRTSLKPLIIVWHPLGTTRRHDHRYASRFAEADQLLRVCTSPQCRLPPPLEAKYGPYSHFLFRCSCAQKEGRHRWLSGPSGFHFGVTDGHSVRALRHFLFVILDSSLVRFRRTPRGAQAPISGDSCIPV